LKTGFIGLGRMGHGMARNLLKSGRPLIVYDRDPAAAGALAEAGAEIASSISELTQQVGVIFTSLPGPLQVEEVALGPGGILENIARDATLFDVSTNSLSLVRRINQLFAQKGASMLDAPVSGGPAGAASGDLVLWVGGNKEKFDQHVELLRAIGKSPSYVGPIGAGTVTKLTHNMLGYTIMLAQAEIFSLAVKAGIDPLDLWVALRLGLVGKGSPLDMLKNQFLPGKYEPPAFALKLAHKDVTLATGLARELGVPMRLSDLTLAEMTEALTRGMGDMDSRAYLQLQQERADVRIAVEPDRLQRAFAS
jgi:3-hydroxyisobutyrate dehydrogenase